MNAQEKAECKEEAVKQKLWVTEQYWEE